MRLPVVTLSRLLLFVAMLLVAGAVTGGAFAQSAPGSGNGESERGIAFGAGAARSSSNPEVLPQQRTIIEQIGRDTERAEQRMRANAEDDGVLVEIRNALDEYARRLIESGVAFRPRLAAINDRLEEIGPAPSNGDPTEPDALREERQSLLSEKAEINTLLGEAEGLSLRVNRLIEQVGQMRRDLFTNTLSRRYDISSALSGAVVQDLIAENQKLYRTVSSWVRFVINYKLQPVLMATFFALLAAAILFVGGRRLFGNLIIADPTVENPTYLSRLSVAFWSTSLRSATVAVFLLATYFFYDYYGVLRIDIGQMMVMLFNVIAIVYFVHRLSRSIFNPNKPNWRLVPIETPAARTLFWLVWLTAIVTGADFFASKVNDVMRSPLSLTIAKSLVATIIVGLLVVAIALVKPFRDAEGRPRGWHRLFSTLLFVLGGGTIVAALLGYIGLARFMSQQMVVTGAILATMYIGHLSARAVSEIGAFDSTGLGRRLDDYFKFDDTTADQLGLFAGIVINIIVVAVGVPLILLQWGFQWGDIHTWVYNVATEVRIGSISISLIGILTGIGLFVIGYFGTRAFQGWLDGKVMARGRVDAGVRNSIGTAVGYAGVALAGLIGISAAGIDMSNLALVAGALSLGIGFGLQNIVNNFVSGLILLAERPFKVGDWIVAGGAEGTVRKISVRATEIETFRRQTVILPNSELINAAVGNWTHRNKLGRVDIPVSVAYENDPRVVHDLLLEIISSQPQALKNPAPSVGLDTFAESGLNFVIRAFVSDISSTGNLTNEVRFQIMERFKERGIGFPSRDLAVRGLPEVLAASHEGEPQDKSSAPAPRKRRSRSKPA